MRLVLVGLLVGVGLFGQVSSYPAAAGGGGGGATNLNGLTDVAITTPANRHFLIHDGSEFINRLFDVTDVTTGTFLAARVASGTPTSGLVSVATGSGNAAAWTSLTGAHITITGSTDDCVKLDASGHPVSAGAACGSGGSGTAAPPYNVTMSGSQQTVTFATHGINGRMTVVCHDANNDFSLVPFNYDETDTTADITIGAFTGSCTIAGLGYGVGDVTQTGTQTLTNKTLTTPTIASFTNATHNHSNAAGGGQIAISSGISGLGTGVATFLGTPSSANLAAAVTGETGTGNLVFSADPVLSGVVTIGSAATPTTDADGEIAVDLDAQGSGRDSIEFFDGTASTYLVGILASDTCTNGQVVKWNTGGTWTCENDSTGSGTPAGSDTEVQYNAAGSFGSEAAFVYNASTNTLTVGALSTGDGSVAGGTSYLETSGNGSNFRRIEAPDALTQDLTLELPDGNPAGSVISWATPSSNVSAGSWLTFGSGVATWLATPSSANLASAVTGETGTGNLVFSADPVITGSLAIPQGTGPTVDATGEIAVDTTSGQFKWYDGTAARALPSIMQMSFVVTAPATTDDIDLMKAPYGMTIVGIDAIIQGGTNVVGQIQECNSSGASCADLDSDITADTDGAADDGSLTDSAIASGGWLRWKTTSVSGTVDFLTVTVRYRVVAD